MKVAHGIVHMPLSDSQAEELRVLYNEFAAEWNRRERDPALPLPRCEDPWSRVDTMSWPTGPMNRVHFRPKGEPEWVWYRLTMRRGWRFFTTDWGFCKRTIDVEELMSVERLLFLVHLHQAVFDQPAFDQRAYNRERRELVHRLETEPDFWRAA